jgi:hypothetical protein
VSAAVQVIPSLGFTRGAVVRLKEDGSQWPNMLVVRGLGETTAVIRCEGDTGGALRLREFPTRDLFQVLGNGPTELLATLRG